MNKEMKQHLETVVTSIINEDSAAGKVAFHEYLRLKTRTILGEKEDGDDKKLPAFMKKKSKKDEDEGSGEESSGDEGSGESSGSGEDESSGEDEKDTKKGNPFAKKKD